MMKPLTLVFVFLLLLVTGCFPYVATYVHIDAPNATRRSDICAQYGAPAIVRIPVEPITIDLNLDPSSASLFTRPYLLVTAPTAARFEFVGNEATVTAPPFAEKQRIRFVPAVDRQATKQRVAASTVLGDKTLYRFAFDEKINAAQGTLELPAINLDGTRLALPAISFERRPVLGIVPLNC